MSDSLIGGEASESTEATTSEAAEATNTDASESESSELLLGKYKSVDDLAEAYKSLESKLGAKEEDIRIKLLEELQADAYEGRPESSGDYQLPDGIDESLAVDNELLEWWSNHAFENGYSQEEFEHGIEMYAQAVMGNQPDLEAEAAKLGENASARIEAASAFASKFFPESALPAIERMCESHEGIVALEHIMEAMQDGEFSGDTQKAEVLNEAALRSMMNDPRYHSMTQRDPAFVKQVDEGFRKLYGGS